MKSDMETDYLIAGSGAVGMAFADVILTETDAEMVIVDRHAKPGGHWNDAYPFVNLHQPSQYYGVSSKELSRGEKDAVGLNKGLYDLASGAEVSAYFDEVMRQRFLPSGRVKYFPMCNYEGDGRFRCLSSGQTAHVTARRKFVDATHLNTTVPSTHTRNFTIDEGVWFKPLNDLPRIQEPPEGYVVIGGGKTGIDACIWLLENRVDPDKITWIMPRDAWLLDRGNVQPTLEFFEKTIGTQAAQMESIAAADSIEDMFDRLEASGYFLRIDPNVRPKMFHGATISQLELEELRRIKNIVRMGRVTAIHADKIVLDEGEVPTSPRHLHVDCSARAVTNEEIVPVFEGEKITLQMVRPYQPVFSAGFIAHIEAAYEDEAKKNSLCNVVPLPNHDTDFIQFTATSLVNQYIWGQEEGLATWLRGNRLDGFSKMIADLSPDDAPRLEIVRQMRKAGPKAFEKLQTFLTQVKEREEAYG